MTPPTAAPRFAGLLGTDLGRSLSPRLHRAWFEEIRMPGDYILLEVGTDNEALDLARALLATRGLLGLNVTLPFKAAFAASPLFTPSPRVRRAGGANVIHRLAGGEWGLENTDVDGIAATLRSLLPYEISSEAGVSSDRPAPLGPPWEVVCLGAGGAARALPEALSGVPVASLTFACREPSRSSFPAEIPFRHKVSTHSSAASPSPTTPTPCATFVTLDDIPDLLSGFPTDARLLVVNALPLGVRGGSESDNPWAVSTLRAATTRFGRNASVRYFDMLYLPSHGLEVAAELGVPALGGALMLQEQGRAAFRLWTGIAPEADPLVAR